MQRASSTLGALRRLRAIAKDAPGGRGGDGQRELRLDVGLIEERRHAMRLVRLKVGVDVFGLIFRINEAEDAIATGVIGVLIRHLEEVLGARLQSSGWEGQAVTAPLRGVDDHAVQREAVDGAPAEAEEDRPGVPSGKGEACNDVPTEGCRVCHEIKPERVAHIRDSGGTGGGLNLRQEIAGFGSWGFNGQAHRQILARYWGEGGTPGGQINLAEPRRCGGSRRSPALPNRLAIDLMNVSGEVDRPDT